MQIREVNSGREADEKVLDAARRREIDLVSRLDRWGWSVTDLLLATPQELRSGKSARGMPLPRM